MIVDEVVLRYVRSEKPVDNSYTIKIKVNGQEYNCRKVFSPHDLESRFDIIFDDVKRQLKEHILNFEKANEL